MFELAVIIIAIALLPTAIYVVVMAAPYVIGFILLVALIGGLTMAANRPTPAPELVKKDPFCDPLWEKDASGKIPMFDRVTKWVKMGDGQAYWLWATEADYQKYRRCFLTADKPDGFGPSFTFYTPADKHEVAVCTAAVPFPPFKRSLDAAKAAGCVLMSFEESVKRGNPYGTPAWKSTAGASKESAR